MKSIWCPLRVFLIVQILCEIAEIWPFKVQCIVSYSVQAPLTARASCHLCIDSHYFFYLHGDVTMHVFEENLSRWLDEYEQSKVKQRPGIIKLQPLANAYRPLGMHIKPFNIVKELAFQLLMAHYQLQQPESFVGHNTCPKSINITFFLAREKLPLPTRIRRATAGHS